RKLTWKNWDERNGVLVLHRHKTSRRTGKPRIIPLPACVSKLLGYLKRRQGGGPDDPVFLNTWGRPWTDDHLAGYMADVRERAGLKPDAQGERLTAYHHRHAYLTEAASFHGIEGVMLQRLAGHTSLEMTTKYA